jgi:hypothetical protein
MDYESVLKTEINKDKPEGEFFEDLFKDLR